MEDWAEIRRLRRAEGMPILAIARVMGVSRNTVKRALVADGPPRYQRPVRGSIVDAVEPRIRELLGVWPSMPATVVAERIGWQRSIRVLRDLTRYRIDLVAARTAEKSRVEKLLEDAGIKLSVVASDIFGVSGRAMLAALIAGQRDPAVLADLARARMRAKINLLEEAFAGLPTGGFGEHHRFLLQRMLGRIDAIDADIAVLDAEIEAHLTPFDQAVQRLD